MSTSMDALGIRKRLGRDDWLPPVPFGPDGWHFDSRHEHGQIIVSCSDHPGYDVDILHASLAYAHRHPTYVELAHLHKAVWEDGFAYMVFASTEQHVNIHEHALHLWGALDGRELMMPFTFPGLRSI